MYAFIKCGRTGSYTKKFLSMVTRTSVILQLLYRGYMIGNIYCFPTLEWSELRNDWNCTYVVALEEAEYAYTYTYIQRLILLL
jgi:hypothetical protein